MKKIAAAELKPQLYCHCKKKKIDMLQITNKNKFVP